MSRHFIWLSALAFGASVAAAQEGTPVNAQPPQLQLTVTTTTTVSPAPEPTMLWGGLTSEALLLPGVSLGLSAPLKTTADYRVLVRGDVSYLVPIGLQVGGDLLFTNGDGRVYGGPSVSWVAWPWPGFAAGGVLGYRQLNTDKPWGFFIEGKLRYLFLKGFVTSNPMTPPPPGGTVTTTVSSVGIASPGLRVGFTYRF